MKNSLEFWFFIILKGYGLRIGINSLFIIFLSETIQKEQYPSNSLILAKKKESEKVDILGLKEAADHPF